VRFSEPKAHRGKDAFLERLPRATELRTVTMAWSSGLVIGARV